MLKKVVSITNGFKNDANAYRRKEKYIAVMENIAISTVGSEKESPYGVKLWRMTQERCSMDRWNVTLYEDDHDMLPDRTPVL